MPTEITLTNIIAYDGHGWPQTAIRSNTTNWQSSSHTPGDGASNSMRIVPTTSGQEATLTSASDATFSLNNAHVYYFSCKIKYEQDADCTFDFYWPIAEPAAISHCQMNLAADVWGRMSGVFSRTDFTSGDYQFRFDYNNEGSNIPVHVTSMMLFDLTDSFGAGKEPSKEWMDAYVTAFADSQTVEYYENLGELFTNIANAIRTKDGTTESIFACDFPERINATGGDIPDRVLIKCPNADGITTVQLNPNKNYYWEVSYAANDKTGGSLAGSIIDGVVAQDWSIGTKYGLFLGPPTYDSASGVLTLTKGYSTTYPSVTRIYGVPGSIK